MNVVKRLGYEFKPENYQLRLQPDAEKMIFSGTVKITGYKVGRPSKRLTFHQKGLNIKEVSLTHFDKKRGPLDVKLKRINTIKASNELRLHTEEIIYPGKYEVRIIYSGLINEEMHGMYGCRFTREGKPAKIIATQLESHYAREIFPCVDEPAAKATFDLTLITNKNVTVLGNTPIKQQNQDKNLVTTFETSPVMSTYLLAFVYGDLAMKESKSISGISVRCFATPAHSHLLNYSLDVATRAIDFFEDYFGVKYPLPKLDMVALPDFSAGAMENWGLITYRESCMLIDEESSNLETKQFAAIIICHEIAHQWFGNLVTMDWWDDLWLNESFANLMEYRAVDELFPEWKIWEHFINNEFSGAMRRDCLPNVQPVRLEVRHPDEINTLFDPAIVYAKGSVLLRMLMEKVGEDLFKNGLREYFLSHKYKNTTGNDLWRALSKASGQELQEFMTPWLSYPGFPIIKVSYCPGDETAQLSQKRFTVGEADGANHIWPVPLSSSTATEPELLKTASQEIRIMQKTDTVFLLNNGGKSYFISHYTNPEHFKTILQSVSNNQLSTINRMLLVLNYVLLERAGSVSTVSNLELLLAFREEKTEAVWSSLSGVIGSNRRLVFDTRGEEPMKLMVAYLVQPLIDYTGWDGDETETIEIKRLRELALSLGASAEIPEIIKEGLKRFRNSPQLFSLPPDIRSCVLYTSVRHGSSDDFQNLINDYKSSTNAEEKEELCQALTAANKPSDIADLIKFLKTPYIRLQDLGTWFARLMANQYAKESAWDWMCENWEWLKQKYGGDHSHDRYPYYAAAGFSHQDELDKYTAFFEPLMDDVSLSRTIQLGIEEISGRVAWRENNQAKATAWLITHSESGFKSQ